MLINPDVLLETMQSMRFISEFQVVIQHETESDPLSMDEMLILVELKQETNLEVVKEIKEQVHRTVNVTPRVEVVDRQEIYRVGVQIKATRFIDRRKTSDSIVR